MKEAHETREMRICDECNSPFYTESSKMAFLCPECAHQLYGYPPCEHDFSNGICHKCGLERK